MPTIVLVAGVADKIKALPGATVSLISPKLIESSIKAYQISSPLKVIVAGIFQTNAKDFDNTFSYHNLFSGVFFDAWMTPNPMFRCLFFGNTQP